MNDAEVKLAQEAVLALKAASENSLGSHIGQDQARALVVFVSELIEDREGLMFATGLTDADIRSARAAAEAFHSLGIKL